MLRSLLCFNPRPACRANAEAIDSLERGDGFQSAPCVQGECSNRDAIIRHPEVSIRALRAGRMSESKTAITWLMSFNPRPACRANVCLDQDIVKKPVSFNPRPACRANGLTAPVMRMASSFQSAPCVQGEWHETGRTVRASVGFNPRPACRANAGLTFGAAKPIRFQSAPCVQGECSNRDAIIRHPEVSIRALRAGRMTTQNFTIADRRSFNPRPACRANAE